MKRKQPHAKGRNVRDLYMIVMYNHGETCAQNVKAFPIVYGHSRQTPNAFRSSHILPEFGVMFLRGVRAILGGHQEYASKFVASFSSQRASLTDAVVQKQTTILHSMLSSKQARIHDQPAELRATPWATELHVARREPRVQCVNSFEARRWYPRWFVGPITVSCWAL